jgi:hypothetical protein
MWCIWRADCNELCRSRHFGVRAEKYYVQIPLHMDIAVFNSLHFSSVPEFFDFCSFSPYYEVSLIYFLYIRVALLCAIIMKLNYL